MRQHLTTSNRFRLFIFVIAVLAIASLTTVSAFAASGITQCNRFWVDGDYTGHIQFIPAHVIEKGESFSLTAKKQVKQAYLTCERVSSGKVIYSSGRQYSATASSKSSSSTISKNASISNTWNNTEKIYYGWLYF
jgi:hypothetical protein